MRRRGEACLNSLRCTSWQQYRHFRSLAGFAVETKAAAEAIGDDAVDDVQAEAGASLVAAGREERIESLTPDVRGHAAAVVGEDDFDVVGAGGAHLDVRCSPAGRPETHARSN